MMNKEEKIDKYLKDLQNMSKNVNLNSNVVYYTLMHFGMAESERGVSCEYLFDRLINNYRNNPNLDVFVSSDWNYFCQFVNDPNNEVYYGFSPIKVYVPLKKEHMEENINKILSFMAQNNVIHHSKLSKIVRVDDLVLRIGNRSDAEKVINFINNNIPKEDMYETNPFVVKTGNVGIALDRYLSYNDVVSKYISLYIEKCNSFSNVASFGDFKLFMNSVLEYISRGENLEFFKNFKENERFGDDEFLVNIKEITSLIVKNLEGMTKENVYFYQEKQSNSDYYRNERSFFENRINGNVNNNSNENIGDNRNANEEDARYLLDELIEVCLRKYGVNKTKLLLNNYKSDSYIYSITRENNLRERVANSNNFKGYLASLSFEQLNDMIDRSFGKFSENVNDEDSYHLLIELISIMNVKYGRDRTFYSLIDYRKRFDSIVITRDNNLRERVENSRNFNSYISSLSDDDIVNLVLGKNNKSNSNSSYDGNVFNRKEIILQNACKATYKANSGIIGYDVKDLVKLSLLAIENGSYEYVTLDDNAREMLKRNVLPNEILDVVKSTLTKEGYALNKLSNFYEIYSEYIEKLYDMENKKGYGR